MWLFSFASTTGWRGYLLSNMYFWYLYQQSGFCSWLALLWGPLFSPTSPYVQFCANDPAVLVYCVNWNLVRQNFPLWFFLLRIALTFWSLLCLHTYFRFFFLYFCEKRNWNFDGECIESVGSFGSIAVSTILTLPVYEHGSSSCLLVIFFSVCSLNALMFSP